jgi:hypothetical protein
MRTRIWLPALAFALGLGVLVATSVAEEAPKKKADPEQIAKLIKQLGSDDFEEREKATKELEKLGGAALDALREASKSGEAEVKSRAASLLDKAERKAAAEKALAPTKVKLVFKDTPLADAIAEFGKKSGYTFQLHDPDKKMKDRKVTLDTGEVTFWEAFDKFCDKAGLVEATWQDVMPKFPPGGGPGGVVPPSGTDPVPPIRIKPAPLPPQKEEAPPDKKEEKKKDEGAAAPARAAVAQVAVAAADDEEAAKKKVEAARRAAEEEAERAKAADEAAKKKAAAQAGGAGGAPAVAIAVRPGGFGGFGGFGQPNIFTLKDGKPETVPTCYSGAIRIRTVKQPEGFGGIGVPLPPVPRGAPDRAPAAGAKEDDGYTVWLEVRAEPKVQLQNIMSVGVEKATDDKDQKLEKINPPAAPGFPGGGGFGGAVPPVPPGGGIAPPGRGIPFVPVMFGQHGERIYPVRFKKGEKEAKALKEFAGTISADVLTPAEPVITADKISKAAGETYKGKDAEGKDNGYIKVSKAEEKDGKFTVEFEMEMPQGIIPAMNGGGFGIGGGMIGFPGGGPIKGVPVPLPAPAPATPPPAAPGGAGLAFQAQAPAAAPAQVQIQIGVGGGGAAGPGGVVGPGGPATAPAFVFNPPGISLVDSKGKTVNPTGGTPPKGTVVGGKVVLTYTLEYKLEKGQEPAKLLFSGSKTATVDIPFTFKDVPLK